MVPARKLGKKQFIKRQRQYLAFSYFYLSYGKNLLTSTTRFLNNHYELYYTIHFLVCLVCIFSGFFFYIKAGKSNLSWPERAITRMVVVQKPSTPEQKLCVCIWERRKLLLCLIQPHSFTVGTFLRDLVPTGIETSHHHNGMLSKASH